MTSDLERAPNLKLTGTVRVTSMLCRVSRTAPSYESQSIFIDMYWNADTFITFDTAMSSGIIQAVEGHDTGSDLEPTVANGDQPSDIPRPPDTLTATPEWRLQRWIESPTSPRNNNSVGITNDEERYIETLKAQENDGLYSIRSGQKGNILVRLICQSPQCQVQAKVIRWQGNLCLYTQHVHQHHLTTPEKGLKKPAIRYIQSNHEKPRQQLLQDLKQYGYHNKSWNDSKNILAIKNAKQSARNNDVAEQGAFANLQELRRALDARHQSIDEFLLGIDLPPEGFAGLQSSSNRNISPLRNIIVLHHDVGIGDNGVDDWSEIIVTVPSARPALEQAPSLWGTGRVQQEADYSQGFWLQNLRQLGMVGISDADRKFHVTVIGIQKSEDGPGSTKLLSYSTELLTKSSAAPSSCLKDGSEALRSACIKLLTIGTDCFAHMVRQPFSRGGGVRGSRGSMSRYLLNHKDEHGKRHIDFRDVFDILSFFFALSHITTLHDWVTARCLFMKENQDLPDHVYMQYLPSYPRWGAACHQSGESKSTQGLEKNWDYLKKAKNYDQKRNATGDLESILEAISEREDQRPGSCTFTTEPTIPKHAWSILSKYHSMAAGADYKSSAYYCLEDGRAIMRHEAIGNSTKMGGYVVYVPNDAFADEWKTEALKWCISGGISNGMTMQQILFQESMTKDTRTCISSQPTMVKASFMTIVGRHLQNNKPKSLPDEDCRSFLMRRSQRDMSMHQLLGRHQSNPKKKKRKTTVFEEEHERELERKKWNTDVEAAFTNDMEKNLPKDPNEDDEEQSEARKWLAEHVRAKQQSQQLNDSGSTGKLRRNRLCGRSCGHFKEIIVQKSGSTKCNCEHFMTKGWCLDAMVFALVEFNQTPPLSCREVDGIGWDRIREGWKKKSMCTMFDELGEEGHANNMYKTYLPETDPLFSYSSIVHAVPVPWLRTSNHETLTLGLGVINKAATTKPGKFQATIGSIAPQSIAKVLEGDVIVKVNGVTVASDDGTLLHGGTIHDVVTAIKQSPKGQILEMDVLREYSAGRSISATMASVTYGNSNDQIHASTDRHNDGRRLSSNAVVGFKTTGLDDSNDEIAY